MSRSSLIKNTASAMRWNALERLLSQILRFIITVILARLLTPEDFGIVAIAMFFVTIAETFVCSGFTHAYIRSDDDDDNAKFSSMLILNVFFSFIFIFIIVAASYEVERQYNVDSLGSVLRVLATILFFDSIASAYKARLERNLEFKKLFLTTVPSLSFSMIVGGLSAYNGLGFWSIVTQTLSFKIFSLISVVLISRQGLKLDVRKSICTDFFSYGWKLQMAAVVNIFSKELNTLLIGKSVNVAAAGLYSRAHSLQFLVVQTVVMIIEKVTFPSFSKFQQDREKLLLWTRASTRIFSFIILPSVAILSACSHEIIWVIFGDNWSVAGDYLKILALIGGVRYLQSSNLTLLKILGYTGKIFKLRLFEAVITVFCLLVGLKFGIIGLVISQVASAYITYVVMALISQTTTGYTLSHQLNDIFPYLLITGCSAMFTIFISSFFQVSNYLYIFVFVLTMLIIYISLSLIFQISEGLLIKRYLFEKWL